eukprot:snap_masked-scaffold_10-processed-gene-8.34-mRNA-1 protein AED:1.00 eAED:1.00 QI:0/0/0/0/1/1/2/0/154
MTTVFINQGSNKRSDKNENTKITICIVLFVTVLSILYFLYLKALDELISTKDAIEVLLNENTQFSIEEILKELDSLSSARETIIIITLLLTPIYLILMCCAYKDQKYLTALFVSDLSRALVSYPALYALQDLHDLNFTDVAESVGEDVDKSFLG